MRLLPKGGHGGHNGMKNLMHHFKGSREFPRMRIGRCGTPVFCCSTYGSSVLSVFSLFSRVGFPLFYLLAEILLDLRCHNSIQVNINHNYGKVISQDVSVGLDTYVSSLPIQQIFIFSFFFYFPSSMLI
jgi:hypothetical protein